MKKLPLFILAGALLFLLLSFPATVRATSSQTVEITPHTIYSDEVNTILFTELMKDYPDFSIKDYTSMEITFSFYSSNVIYNDSTRITFLSREVFGDSRIALNNTKTSTTDYETGKSIYDGGRGKGLASSLLLHAKVLTHSVSFDLTNLTETPDCLTLTIDKSIINTPSLSSVTIESICLVPGEKETPIPSPTSTPSFASPAPQKTAASVAKPSAAANFRVTGRKKEGIHLSWKISQKADRTQIYRSTKKDSGYRRIAFCPKGTTSYSDTMINSDTRYYYKIRIVRTINSKKLLSAFTSPGSVRTRTMRKPTIQIQKKQAGSTRFFQVRLKKYQGTHTTIYLRQGKKYLPLMLSYHSIKKKKGTYNIRYLGKQKNYQFRVRTYRIVKGVKLYSPYSASVTMRV